MSYQSEFFADPVGFLQTHVVRSQFIDGSAKISESRPLVLTIRQIADATVVGRSAGRVFHLSANVANLSRDEKMPVYWLGYVAGSATDLMLGDAGRMMFTANMDGCTLGIGSQAGAGGCRVSHANDVKSGDAEAQRVGQVDKLRGVFGDQGFRMLEPSSYKLTSTGAARFNATNFGINQGGRWSFFTHTWMNLASEGEHKVRGRHVNGGCRAARPVPPTPG